MRGGGGGARVLAAPGGTCTSPLWGGGGTYKQPHVLLTPSCMRLRVVPSRPAPGSYPRLATFHAAPFSHPDSLRCCLSLCPSHKSSMEAERRPVQNGKGRKRKAAGGAVNTNRSKNFTPGECVGILTAAATHWAAYRASRTGDMKRRAGGAMLDAFVNATPTVDQSLARTREAVAVDKKIKNMRTRYADTCLKLKSTGMSAAQREDLIIKFGGAILFDLAREAFKKSHVSTQLTVREPVDLMAAAQVRSGELGGARGVHSESSTAGDESARDGGASRRSGGVNGLAEATAHAPGSADHAEGPESDGDGGSTASGRGDVSDVRAESPLAPGPSAPVRDISATATAAEIAASSPGRKKAKKDTAVGLLREYLESKRRAEQTSGEEGGTSANDVRKALVNMMNAYAEKARRGL